MKLIQNKLMFENLQKMLVNRKYKLDKHFDFNIIIIIDILVYTDENDNRVILINDILDLSKKT